MADSSLRLVLLLRQIPREPQYISSKHLQERLADAGHDVTLRTIQRDLQSISLYLPLVQNSPQGRGKTGLGWAFARSSQNISLPLMGSAAALTLSMAVQHLQALLPPQVLEHLEPYHQEARQILATHKQGKYGDWSDKVRVVSQNILLPAPVDKDTLGLIYQALLESRQFIAVYNDQPDRIIHPYGLVQQGTTLYLICRWYEYDDIRITALQRYASVQLLDEPVRPFPEFCIDDYLEEGAMYGLPPEKQMLELELRVDSGLAWHLRECPISSNQCVTEAEGLPDHFLIKATLQDSAQLRRWLLSQAPQLEILQPATLREWMREVACNEAKKYRSSASSESGK